MVSGAFGLLIGVLLDCVFPSRLLEGSMKSVWVDSTLLKGSVAFVCCELAELVSEVLCAISFASVAFSFLATRFLARGFFTRGRRVVDSCDDNDDDDCFDEDEDCFDDDEDCFDDDEDCFDDDSLNVDNSFDDNALDDDNSFDSLATAPSLTSLNSSSRRRRVRNCSDGTRSRRIIDGCGGSTRSFSGCRCDSGAGGGMESRSGAGGGGREGLGLKEGLGSGGRGRGGEMSRRGRGG